MQIECVIVIVIVIVIVRTKKKKLNKKEKSKTVCKSDESKGESAMNKKLEPFEDRNQSKYHAGEKCIEEGWSPFWRFECNAKRMRRTLNEVVKRVGYGTR